MSQTPTQGTCVTQGTRNSSAPDHHVPSHVLSVIASSNRYIISLTRAHGNDSPCTASFKNYILGKINSLSCFFVFIRGIKQYISIIQKSWRQRSASTFMTLIYSFKSLLQKRSGRHRSGREGGGGKEHVYTESSFISSRK